MTEMKTVWDLVYLAVCAVREIPPDPDRVRNMDLPALYTLGVQQGLEALLYLALEPAGVLTGPLEEKWKERKNKAIRKNLLLTIEREKLFAWMEEAGCWYLPLKGILLEPMYPRAGMRQMADNDILFDPAFRSQVRDWFQSQGYEVYAYEKYYHDIYQKLPVLGFEMHVSLFDVTHPSWADYWCRARERFLADGDCRYGRKMCDEDFYLYILNHSYKHFSDGGTGFRILLDMYVFLKARGAAMDFAAVRKGAEELGIRSYEEDLRDLMEAIFRQDCFSADLLSEDQQQLLKKFFAAGLYGTRENSVQIHIEEKRKNSSLLGAKLRYMKDRLYPDDNYLMKFKDFQAVSQDPRAKKRYKIRRIFRNLIHNRQAVIQELKMTLKSK